MSSWQNFNFPQISPKFAMFDISQVNEFPKFSPSIHGFDLPQVKCVGWKRLLSTRILHYNTSWVVEPTHLTNMLVKLDAFPNFQDEQFTKNETTTLVTTINPS